MIDPESLLAAVSAENPCGEDVTYDPKFLELDTLIAGKPETQFSIAEEPDWKGVRDACLALFARSKHLRVAALLCLAAVKLEGAAGLQKGLTLIKGLLETYWADLYPKLDPADNNDPLERVNIVASLSSPIGTFGDPIRFLQNVRQIPLTNSPQMGRFGLADLSGGKAASAAQVAAAFRDTPAAQVEGTYQAISQALVSARGIDDFLTHTIGADKAPDMDALKNTLAEMQKALGPYVSSPVPDAGASAVESAGGAPAPQSAPGAIESRQDVQRALDRICDYYARKESSSPVPLLLKRARRLVDMDFMQIVNDLAPDALGQVNVITGHQADQEVSSGETASPANDEPT